MVADRDSADREGQLDEVIASYLEAVESGEVPDRTQWLARYPHLADDLAAFFADEARFDGLVSPLRVGTPAPSGLIPRNGIKPAPNGQPELAPVTVGRHFGDYEILEEVARGGMGVVYRARQVSLNRIVALKMIRDAEWATAADVQRFRLEAEAVANLEHPNIIPIYEIGAHGGQHYFSMKWVAGGSLAQAVADGEWPATGREGERSAGRLLAAVARAVHHAHQRGILHRDLKPANILLEAVASPRGEPLTPHVTDFGLAKRVTADDGLTQTGVAVGTPSYMAPEQASPPKADGKGKGTGSTMAADVYSLGAVLYELLTGRPPFRGETILDTLREVIECEPVRPRLLNAALDRDLETICLKCLEKDPAKRYPSAAALADDLERWLGGEPIQARAVGNAERFWRWCRRNRTLATVSALAAAALLTSTVVSFLLAFNEARFANQLTKETYNTKSALADAERERDKAEKNLTEAKRLRAEAEKQRLRAEEHFKEAERQRQLEEQSFRQAHQAVAALTRLSDQLRTVPGLQSLRRMLLEESLGYYQRFVEQRGNDKALKRELADAQFDTAHISSEIGQRLDAVKSYRAALKIYDELLAARAADVAMRDRVAHTSFNLGTELSALGRPKEALACFEQTRKHYGEILQAQPNHAAADAGLSDLYGALGALHRGDGRLAEAHAAFAQAVAIREKLAKAQPRNARRQDSLALCYNNLGVILLERRREGEALEALEKAKEIRERRRREEPKSNGQRMGLAATYRDLGILYRDRGGAANRQKALDYLQKARDLRAEVAKQNPSAILVQTDLASSLVDIGGLLRDQGNDPGNDRMKLAKEALACYNQAIGIQGKLVLLDPASPYLQADLALTHFLVGKLFVSLPQWEPSLKAFSRAREIAEKLVRSHPDGVRYRHLLGSTLHTLGRSLLALGRPDEARLVVQQGIEQEGLAAARAPEVEKFRLALRDQYATLADVERKAGRLPEAVAATLERQKVCAGNAAALYSVATDLARLADLVGQGKGQPTEEEQARRRAWQDLVLAALREAVAAGFRDARRLREDPALQAVRARDDFRELLDGLPK